MNEENFQPIQFSTAGTVPLLLKKSVLIIDDSLDSLNVQKLMLESEGFNIYTAQSGQEALDLLLEKPELNLILLDMKLGDMTGTQFLATLEKQSPTIVKNVPVVFLTGMDTVPRSKAVGFIRKPADLDKLLREVHRFIEVKPQTQYPH